MASSEQKIQALEVHLPYELLMLRCAYRQIQSERNQLAWNMTLETFVLHARILEVFLTNGDDNRNFNAKDFSSTFAAGPVGPSQGPQPERASVSPRKAEGADL
jgi:hypothetical protein